MSETNGYATRDGLLGRVGAPRRYADVIVDGQKFRLRSLTALESNLIQARAIAADEPDEKARDLAMAGARTIVQCVVDSEGNRVFADDDVPRLMELDAGFVARLAAACQKHAQIEPDRVEQAEKNSETTPACG